MANTLEEMRSSVTTTRLRTMKGPLCTTSLLLTLLLTTVQLQLALAQVPGIFDLSVGGSNSNSGGGSNNNFNSNREEEAPSETATDPPVAIAAVAEEDPFAMEEEEQQDNSIASAQGIRITPAPSETPRATENAAVAENANAAMMGQGAPVAIETAAPTVAAADGAAAAGTPAPTPVPEVSATYTSSGRGTNFPTVPISLLDLPATVDISECRKQLTLVDVDRNNQLKESEYVSFVHQIVKNTYELHGLGNAYKDGVWGTTLDTLPPGIQVLYKNLNQGGTIDIMGYKSLPEDIEKPSLVQELFLIKVCVHTEVMVHQVLKEGGATQAYSIPEVEVVSVYSSFQLSNKVGLTSSNLQPDTGTNTNRKGLDLAYQTLVTQVVSDKVGQELSMVAPANTDTAADSTSTASGREATRRQLTITVDPKLPEIYRIDDTPCAGQGNIADALKVEWCQTAYGKFLLYLVGEDDLAVYDDYSQAVQTATANGQLQANLEQVEPNAEVRVTDAGATILPPPPTPSPTTNPVPAPTAAGHPQLVVPEEQLKIEEGDEKHENMEMIFVLAAILMTVNCCIISVSVYLCWKNRNNADIDLGVYDDDPSINDAYYENLRANRKKRMQRSNASKASNSSRSNFSSESAPPTMDDILGAQAAAPAPSPTPMAVQDAQARERILRGQGTSSYSAASGSSAAPTKEEIEATLHRSAAANTHSQPSTSHTGSQSHVSFEDDSHSDRLPVNSGEMA